MKRGTPDHPKTLHLAEELGVSRTLVVGLLEMLWHFTARYAPQGDVGRWRDERIEEAVGWDGAGGEFVRGCLKVGFLDQSSRHRVVVHDWAEHADEWTKKSLRNKGLPFLTQSRRNRDGVERQSGTQSPPPSHSQSQLPEPVPEPSLAEPEVGSRGSEEGAPEPQVDPEERLPADDFLDAVKVRLSGVLSVEQHATWIRPLEHASWRGDTLRVEVPTHQHRDWLKGAYADRIKRALADLGRPEAKVQLVVRAREPASVHEGAL